MNSNKHNCKSELQSFDLRATPARIAIMRLLEISETPIDVQTMIDYLDKQHIQTDPATVFRIINIFTQKGVTRQIQLHEGKFRYELSSQDDHHHLICENCGNITDISDCNISALEKEIKQKKHFFVKNHSLEFFGLCQECHTKLN